MPEEVVKPEEIDVNLPVKQAGQIKFLTSTAAYSNPAPDKLKRVLTAIRYTLVGIMTAVSATDLFTGGQTKIICFALGITIIVCGGIEFATGVKPLPEDK